jgi:hypothetical protein
MNKKFKAQIKYFKENKERILKIQKRYSKINKLE